jgi:hypothetical protein
LKRSKEKDLKEVIISIDGSGSSDLWIRVGIYGPVTNYRFPTWRPGCLDIGVEELKRRHAVVAFGCTGMAPYLSGKGQPGA